MKKLLIASIALFSMVACNTQIIETPVSEEEYGYINLGILTDSEMVITKAGELTSEDLESYEITLSVKDGAVLWTKEYIDIEDADLKVAKGTYTITATNLKVEEAYADKGQVRLSGTEEVIVNAGATATCTITCTPINSKVSFKYTEAFSTVFPTISTLTVGDATRTLDMTALKEGEAGAQDVAYFEPSELTWKLAVLNTNGETKNYTNTFTTTMNNWSVVTFDVKGTNGAINIVVKVDGDITETTEISVEIDPLG